MACYVISYVFKFHREPSHILPHVPTVHSADKASWPIMAAIPSALFQTWGKHLDLCKDTDYMDISVLML